MKRRAAALTIQVGIALLVSACAPTLRTPLWSRGEWSSTTSGAPPFRFDVATASAEYDGAECRGRLDLLETKDDALLFAYVLAKGAATCAVNGTVVVRRSKGGRSDYRWFDSDGWLLERTELRRPGEPSKDGAVASPTRHGDEL